MTGSEAPTEVTPARRMRRERTFLMKPSIHATWCLDRGHPPCLRISYSPDFREIRILPGEELDDLNAGE